MRSRTTTAIVMLAALTLPVRGAFGEPQQTLNACQGTVAKEANGYVQGYIKLIGGCMDSVSAALIQDNETIATVAARCQKAFRGLVNTSKPAATLAAKFAAKVEKQCAQAPIGNAEHTDADIYGIIGTSNLGSWCGMYGGSGSVANLDAWVSCLTAAGTCAARESLATTYPRLLEWLNRVEPEIAALDPDCGGSCEGACTNQAVIDACSALSAVEIAIDGPTDDDLPEITCGAPRGPVTARPLQTGQTNCYDLNGEGEVIACAGTGQDGESQYGVARSYTFDNTVPDERTVVDNRTGLEWEVLCDETPLGAETVCGDDHNIRSRYTTWSSAYAKIAAMNAANYAGHSDWRLPNFRELQTLVKYGERPTLEEPYFGTNCDAPCSVQQCSCISSTFDWSSTTCHVPGSLTAAWLVRLVDGLTSTALKKYAPATVRAVRTF